MNQCMECGGELISEVQGSCLSVKCLSCGMSYATTWYDEFTWDHTDYKIILTDTDCNAAKLKAIAEITGFNYLTIRKMSQNIPQELYHDNARVIKEKKKLLDDADVKYTIEPKWKY